LNGYPSNNGRILLDHYQDEDKIDTLLSLGALSSLGPEIGEQHDFEDKARSEWCMAYCRDRGEVIKFRYGL